MMCFEELIGFKQQSKCFSQESKHWEAAFRVYERGVALFKYPHVRDIWSAYLAQFVERYQGSKLERARDLFRQALDAVRRGFYTLEA